MSDIDKCFIDQLGRVVVAVPEEIEGMCNGCAFAIPRTSDEISGLHTYKCKELDPIENTNVDATCGQEGFIYKVVLHE